MSNEGSTIENRQKNELEALKAIYGEDLKDLRRKSAWNQWIPLDISITLIPQQGNSGFNEINAKTDLHITCSNAYPNEIPKISLENTKGLPRDALIKLKNELDNKARQLKGEEMIFELCQYVKEYLHLHSKPATKSFYDEMLQRQREREQKDLEAKQLETKRQKQFMLEEIQRRQEILKSEFSLRKEYKFGTEESLNSFDSLTETESDTCNHKKAILIEFHNSNREIQRGQCLKHADNHIVFTGLDRNSGEIVLIYEWTINNEKNNLDFNNLMKQFSSLEQECNYLMKLKHPNLANYYGIKCEWESDKTVKILLLKQLILGSNCSALFIKEHFKIDIEFIKYISKGVLRALDYLHRNNVVHRDLKKSCIFLNEKGTVILSKYSLHKRLLDLLEQSHNSVYNRKNDIYKFGTFLLSLIKGTTTDENITIPDSIPSDFYDFLTKCLVTNEKDRLTAAQLLEHSFISKPILHLTTLPKINENFIINRNSSPDFEQSDILTHSNTSQSRITNEFEFLQYLGKGAFGDVIKVRNILDRRYYAIKRIQLNPKNKQLNKKIVREVKLLSRLNHENVVRYYNSWIETTTIKTEDENWSKSSSIPKIIQNNDFTINDNIEELAPAIKNIEISITYDSKSQKAFQSSSDEEDSSDEDENWGIFNGCFNSDSIEFQRGDEEACLSTISSDSEKLSNSQSLQENGMKQIDFMYIQMEFCEKSTLRIAIDNNLYMDEARVWRLFREIVEGLAHIHQQGMIHRDLKPVNIFLDYEDHVKIGDFGLATMNITSKYNEFMQDKLSSTENEYSDVSEESKTGLIGTALYVAPELTVGLKAIYNQKVDIYSLGIIFFEMCYRPLSTTMERIKILTGLRKKDFILPEDFLNSQNEKQQFLIKWLLDHDISKRPTSQELLQSEYVPPPVLEECELRELVRHTLSNPHMKAYKYLIASCFDQSFTPAQDLTYDKDPSTPNIIKPLELYDFAKEVIIKIFKQHGGQNITTPLLMPKSKFYDNVESYVKLMTHFGGIVSLPHDLRVPFARYIAWNGVSFLRRYSIERVYREKKVYGFLPRELSECAFDIVTPTQENLIYDAEILYLMCEIINSLPGVKNKHFVIRLNHTLLLKAILLHFGIKDKHSEVFQLMTNFKDEKLSKFQISMFFAGLGFSDNTIATILNIFNTECSISKAINQFQMITKKKSGEACHLAKQALQELKLIIHNAEAFGVTFDIVIAPGIAYNIQQYSGMIFQFVCELKKKHKEKNIQVLAVGGRYDSMIAFYRNIMEHAMLSRDVKQSAVGISISLDKLVQAIQKEQLNDLPKLDYLDVVVCSVGTKSLIKEKTKILKNLWTAGIRGCLIEAANIEEIQEQCNELKVAHVIMLKDSEHGTVRVRSWEKERFQEKTCKVNEIVENMQRIIKVWNDNGNQEHFSPFLMRLDSKSNNIERNDNETNVLILFVTVEKLSSNARKRFETQIRSQMDHVFKRLSGFIVVLGLSFEVNVIRTLASYLEFDSEQDFQKSVANVIEKHQRYKKYLIDVCDEIYEQKLKRSKPILILFSLPDSSYKLIV